MLYLISMGLDPKMSFKTMEAVRKGKVKAGKAGDWPMWVEEMRKHDVPEWYIESLAKIGYSTSIWRVKRVLNSGMATAPVGPSTSSFS